MPMATVAPNPTAHGLRWGEGRMMHRTMHRREVWKEGWRCGREGRRGRGWGLGWGLGWGWQVLVDERARTVAGEC